MLPIRVILHYATDTASIESCRPLRGPLPALRAPVAASTGGLWAEVLDRDSMAVHYVPLSDPEFGGEVFGGDDGYYRATLDGDRVVALELPWPGTGARLRVRNGSSNTIVADLPLDPAPFALPLGADAPPSPQLRPIWGHDNPNAKILAFYAEGFTTQEMPTFRAFVDRCVKAFETTPPFTLQLASLAVAEVETVSRQSGLAGTSVHDTWFRGRFQEGSLDRVILIDQTIAARTLDSNFSRSAVAMIVVNTAKYGGSGGVATVFSCEPNWAAEIAMHELGHSLFGLADEYDVEGQASTDKPVEANVSSGCTATTLKWFNKVVAGTPLPTLRRDEPEPEKKPLGAYEGAKYKKEGYYRAEYDCKMRTPGKPFCRVCSAEITRILTPHRP